MGACGLAAVVVVLLLASPLLKLPAPASASGRSLREGENPNSGEDAPPPNVSGQQQAETESKQHQKSPTPLSSPPENTNEGGEAQASASSPPPPPAQETNPQKAASPPPGVPGPNGGTGQEESQGRSEETDKLKKAMEKCDALHKCSSSGKEFSACLQVSDNASVESYIIVQNEGQHAIDVIVKEPSSNINNDNKKSLHLIKGAFGPMNIIYSSTVGNITLSDGKEDCIIYVGQSVSNLQQQFQQLAAYAMRLNPIYGASLFGFTIVLVGVVCVCCKFAKRRANDAVPYQQIEMGGQAPNSSGADNTASTTDGWEEGWDDDWDDEEAPAGPADKKPTSSVSANGLSLRSQTQTKSKDGWDVDWDD